MTPNIKIADPCFCNKVSGAAANMIHQIVVRALGGLKQIFRRDLANIERYWGSQGTIFKEEAVGVGGEEQVDVGHALRPSLATCISSKATLS